jgi:hypothetical protein
METAAGAVKIVDSIARVGAIRKIVTMRLNSARGLADD